MSEYEFEIHLQQHTPILHFQGGYAASGATLRATELKPKLDRYIKANYNIKPEWRIGKTDALNYKLKVIDGNGETAYCSSLPMYFAEPKKKPNDANYSKKPTVAIAKKTQDGEKTVEYSITLLLFCLNKELAAVLKQLDYNSFFLATNFGTRQSKGYGSYTPANRTLPTELLGKQISVEKGITYRVDSFFSPDFGEKPPTWEKVMNCINDVYKCFRSGINEDGLYFKSLMFAYAKSKGEWWDKRIIKECFFQEEVEEQREKLSDREEPDPLAEEPKIERKELYPMFRDNLGLATSEDWRDYSYSITKKANRGIARFKSPILFKPLYINGQWCIFLLHRELPDNFKNATLTVNVAKVEEICGKKIKNRIGTINTKTYSNFSMDSFIDYVLSLDDYSLFFKANNENAELRRDGILRDLNELKKNYNKK